MGKLIYATNVSIDGYIEDEHGAFDWLPVDDEVFAFHTELLRSAGTFLYGRRPYEAMAGWDVPGYICMYIDGLLEQALLQRGRRFVVLDPTSAAVAAGEVDLPRLVHLCGTWRERDQGALATVTVVRPHLQWGVAELRGDAVTGFVEKPRSEHWINGGFFCFEPGALRYVGENSVLEREPLERLAALYRSVDGFLVVSGEYNNGIPPALKNLLDHFLEEYFFRPSGIVCYSAGGFGGVRAAMQLRMTLAELGMPSIPSLLPIPRIGESLSDDGIAQLPITERSMNRFLDEFLWYANALAEARAEGTPY